MGENTEDVLGLQPSVPLETHASAHSSSVGQGKQQADRPGFELQLLPSCTASSQVFSLSLTFLLYNIGVTPLASQVIGLRMQHRYHWAGKMKHWASLLS